MNATDEIIVRILEREGGVADVGDGKGITRWGQTPQWLAQFDLPIPTNEMEAAENYKAWLRKTRLAELVPYGALGEIVIDWAVHSGHVLPIKSLQKHVFTTEDGVIGPKTLVTVRGMDADDCLDILAANVIADRIEQQGKLIESNPAKFARYAHGWARRNAELVRRLHL
jgi:lysozyme family protein